MTRATPLTRLPARAAGRIRRISSRAAKYARLRAGGVPDRPSAPLYVLGCQRSGTNMLLDALDRSRAFWTYNEDHPAAFDDFRLISPARTRALLGRAPAAWVAFKALADSQNADRLLEGSPEARVVWPFRDYRDVARSAVKKWGRGQLALIRRAATEPGWDHWLVERMDADRRDLIRSLFGPELSINSAAALKWYLRNALYYDRGLDRVPDRAMLLRYEDLVRDPVSQLGRLFRWTGVAFDPNVAADVTDASLGGHPLDDLDERVRELCENLQARLVATSADEAGRAYA